MTLRLTDEEREMVRTTLATRLDAVRAEMTRTDTPGFSLALEREERMLRGLVDRLGRAGGTRAAAGAPGRRRPGARRGAAGRKRRAS
jgi:hypothetical protein